jgi:hypothetical protein
MGPVMLGKLAVDRTVSACEPGLRDLLARPRRQRIGRKVSAAASPWQRVGGSVSAAACRRQRVSRSVSAAGSQPQGLRGSVSVATSPRQHGPGNGQPSLPCKLLLRPAQADCTTVCLAAHAEGLWRSW